MERATQKREATLLYGVSTIRNSGENRMDERQKYAEHRFHPLRGDR